MERVRVFVNPHPDLKVFGVPYFVSKLFNLEELLGEGMISEDDIKCLREGETIKKRWKVR